MIRPAVSMLGASDKHDLVLHADSQLAIGFVNCTDCIHAMAPEIMGSVLQMVLGIMQRAKRIFDLWMSSGSGRRRRQRDQKGKQSKRTHELMFHSSSLVVWTDVLCDLS
jgi:hypothetical protein